MHQCQLVLCCWSWGWSAFANLSVGDEESSAAKEQNTANVTCDDSATALPSSLGLIANRAPPGPRPPTIGTISTIGVQDSFRIQQARQKSGSAVGTQERLMVHLNDQQVSMLSLCGPLLFIHWDRHAACINGTAPIEGIKDITSKCHAGLRGLEAC
ncbi:uncharacterized protein F5147DRAFT_651180 [Suillus discolor]|uniref:Uncharacterized protein n=1 Tax=Suillus discolor TaxID=1912936 RepID=A0A9P7JW86_9AGAM|nr:uncharacterized protein F5147DRAFT_651180 [Suillus discolor]KAG2111499.1 hypothetical protein F5147DRAFT_651180 [Suillus discolor]